jgi:aminoglycoside phosphotransferase (APT) family kinase protein
MEDDPEEDDRSTWPFYVVENTEGEQADARDPQADPEAAERQTHDLGGEG